MLCPAVISLFQLADLRSRREVPGVIEAVSYQLSAVSIEACHILVHRRFLIQRQTNL
ncbi:MAG: hypothetical protein KME25_18670 [Symplocastrum torsivum CPER-KK1]|uniref:Uncharacterized protein n=1 Tax=Symplocastrum torsivum CPER-KK1 TaxID=450513 RepID=A0A951UAG1_9CYAN|nr:hypothetical protein [Symplocastrum torsivum CPER-KK1]